MAIVDIDSTAEYYYGLALEKVAAVRENRKKAYGNSWLGMEDFEYIAMMMQKVRRLKAISIDKKGGDYENVRDCLIDNIIWSTFMLAEDLRKNG